MNNIDKNIIQKWNHLSSKKIFIACSGGVDSMTLLAILSEAKWDIEVIHVNYNLRGQDSLEDQYFVEKTCKDYNIPFHLKEIELQPILNEKSGNLQEIARKIRYEFFHEKKNLSIDNYIALGHHLDDQIETFFMHIARKSGIMGMACMLAENNRFIRPLLPYSKQEIIQFALKKGITWREDYTNKTNKYTRNILRNIILPELNKEMPTLNNSILYLIEKFQETQFIIEKSIQVITENILKTGFLLLDTYDSLSSFEKNELLRQLNQKSSLLSEIEKLRFSQKGKVVMLNENKYNFSQILKEENNFLFVQIKNTSSILPILTSEEINCLPISFTKESVYIDPKKINGKLTLRTWNIGDRMKPIGMKGSKLISDIIKDAKIPYHQKKDILVVEDEEKILWCVGIKVSREAIASDKTVNPVKLSLNFNNLK